MFYTIKILSLPVIFLTSLNFAYPQENKSGKLKAVNDRCLHYRGHIKTKVAAGDSITFSLFRNYLFEITGKEVFVTAINKNGTFDITLPRIKHPAKIAIGLYGSQHLYLRDYIAEAGDNIIIDVNIGPDDFTIDFTGKGSAKYECIRKLETSREAFNEGRTGKKFKELRSSYSFPDMYKHFKKFHLNQQDILNKYVNPRDGSIRKLIDAEFLSYIPSIWELELVDLAERATNEDQREKVRKAYNMLTHFDSKTSPGVQANSRNYIQYLLIRENARLYFQLGFKKADWQQEYNNILTRYSGKLREKLLTNFLLDFGKRKLIMEQPENYYGCVADACAQIKSNLVRKVFNDQIYSFDKGKDAYEFNLPDTSGKIVSLKNFKGQVVMIDVWYTGCTGCLYFSNKFEKAIYPFINKDSLTVISISIDKSKEVWLKTIPNRRYTQPEFINLYTEGLGDEHPLLKFYNVIGLPFVLLIGKDGYIYSAIQSDAESNKIISTLNQAIRENIKPN